MRPTDPRLRTQLTVATRPLLGVLAGGAVGSLLVIAQAFAVTALVVAVVGQDPLTLPAVLVAVVVLVRTGAQALTDLAAQRAATAVTADLRRRIVSATVTGRTATMPEGELTALATRGVAAAEPYLTRYLPALVLAAVLPALTVVAIATQDLLSAVIVLATLPLVPVFGILVGLATRDRAETQWRAMASLSGHFVDVMRGLPTLVAFRRARAQSTTIRAITERYRRASVETLRIAFASSAVLELVATLSVALVAVTVGVRLAGGGLDLRTGLVVLLLAPEAYWPLRRVGAEFHAAAEGVATFEALSVLDPAPGSGQDEPTARPGTHRMILGRDLGYTYPGRTAPALTGIDLAVAPASLTVLEGPSGCGKSTLLALLAGLLEPGSGDLRVGPARCFSEAWRTQVAWIPQRPAFLPGTVADNLRLGSPQAGDAELWAVLSRVALAERIRLLGGLEARVGEDGRLLSAGERARLALARAVLADRPWVLLDEPTAHLDPLTRKVLLDVIVEESRTRGVVVVSHDAETVAAADRVITLPASPSRAAAPATREADPDLFPVPQDDAPTTSDSTPRPGFGWSTLLGSLSSISGIALTATAGWLIVKAAEQPPVLTMLVAIVGVRTFGLARPVLRYAERVRSHDAALGQLARRRVEVYESLVPLTPGRLGKRRGDVLASVVDDVDATLDRELRIRLPLRTYLVALAVSGAVAVALSPAAGAVVVASSALGAALAYLIARVGCSAAEQDAVATRGQLSAAVLEVAHLATELRMWQAGDRAHDDVESIGARLAASGRQVAVAMAAARASVLVSVGAGLLGTAALLAPQVAEGTVSGPVAALLCLLPIALGDVAGGVVEAGALLGRVRRAEARLAAYAATPPAVAEAARTRPVPDEASLTGERLSLGWVSRPVLTDLDLEVAEGEKVAVVGPSGSGKSTLAATLVRFIDPLDGEVRLGDVGLADLGLDAVRSRIGIVDDDPHVFASTVAENVRFARPGASDAEVLAALYAAHLGDWADGLPHGMRTLVGDGHAQLSGGERARLGIARAVLADQPVLVLDEPVAHLDRATAEAVTRDLLDSAGSRTVVWVSHSDVGLDQMDQIVDLGAPRRERLRP